jgi:hypothetical protein
MVESNYSPFSRVTVNPATQTSASATSGEVAFEVFVKGISDGSDAARLALAQRLKDAGIWTGKISSKFDLKYYTALAKLEEKYQGQVALDKMVGATTPTARYDVLADIIANGEGTGGPSVRKEVRISDQTTAKALIDAIFQDTLGRKASGKEILKYTKNLQAAQKAAPTVTTYGTSGRVTSATTTGGINEQQYLIDQIAGTDEAKTNQVLGYYKTFMDALGGK